MDDITGVFREPFNEQVAFFRNKLQELRPTQNSSVPEYQKAAHDKAFMVAGAQCADLLSDFAAAVDKAISQGTSLKDFQKDFDKIVDQRGWSHNGSRNWRSKIIYTTNLSTSYAAARLAQIKEDGFSHMVYKHSKTVENPRLAHVALDGTTLPVDHEFWNTHYPPNGWGCQCRVVGVNKPSDAQRYADEPKYTAPQLRIDPNTGLPEGVSKGWDYKPGATVVDTIRSLANKTHEWDKSLQAIFMDRIEDDAIRDLFIDSYLSLPSTKDEVRRIATQAIKEKGGDKNTYFPFAALDSKTIQEIKKLFPQSKKLHNKIREQGTFSLSSELLWHSDRGHGVKRVENGERLGEDDKSQRPVLFKDYEKIPGILREPDTVNYGAGTTKRRGWTTIEYRKRIDDELHVLIMAILTGQRKVVAHNMYIKKKPSSRK